MERKRGDDLGALGVTSGPVIGWPWDPVLSFPIGKVRAPLQRPPSSGVLEGLLTLALRAQCLFAFALHAESPSLERMSVYGLKIKFSTFYSPVHT